jgi:uncharacterized membrane protein
MLHTLNRVTGAILWANLHLLFWLSLVPFSTAWMSVLVALMWLTPDRRIERALARE